MSFNPYQAPASEVSVPRPVPPRSTAVKVFATATVLHLAWAAVVAPVYWELVRTGAISMAYFLGVLLAEAFLSLGALSLWRARASARILFGLSAGLGALCLLSWRPGEAVAGTLLAAMGLWLAIARGPRARAS
jgi:uncharacterized membrane protein